MNKLLKYIKDNDWDYELSDGLLWFAYNAGSGVRKHFLDIKNKTFHCEYQDDNIEVAGIISFELLTLLAGAIS